MSLIRILKTAAKRLVQPQSARVPMPNVGDPAPAFDLLAHNGERIRSADLAGSRYVLWFYPKADTPG